MDLIDEKKRVLVQGITGREGRARTRLMREYGTNVVGGVTPGKGGQSALGVPVFNTPQEAVNSLGNIDVSVVSFVPAAGVEDVAISAIEAGIKLAASCPIACRCGTRWRSLRRRKRMMQCFWTEHAGRASPGKAVVGMIGGRRRESARQWFEARCPERRWGDQSFRWMGIEHRLLSREPGPTASSIVHIGGDAVLGIRLPDAALMFELIRLPKRS